MVIHSSLCPRILICFFYSENRTILRGFNQRASRQNDEYHGLMKIANIEGVIPDDFPANKHSFISAGSISVNFLDLDQWSITSCLNFAGPDVWRKLCKAYHLQPEEDRNNFDRLALLLGIAVTYHRAFDGIVSVQQSAKDGHK